MSDPSAVHYHREQLHAIIQQIMTDADRLAANISQALQTWADKPYDDIVSHFVTVETFRRQLEHDLHNAADHLQAMQRANSGAPLHHNPCDPTNNGGA